jgi:ABC-type sugar transport system ATPase subunit
VPITHEASRLTSFGEGPFILAINTLAVFLSKNDEAVIVLCQETTELWAICETMLVMLVHTIAWKENP